MPRSRKSLLALIALGLVLAALLAYVGIAYSDPYSPLPLPLDRSGPKPRVLMDRPPETAHWTLQRAYEADQEEHRWHTRDRDFKITAKPDSMTVTLGDSDAFAFSWHDSGGAMSLYDFKLNEDRTASLVYYRHGHETRDGKQVGILKHYRAEFTLSATEVAALRKLLIDAKLGTAPQAISREDIYDGAQWQMDLTANGSHKMTYFSNAFPDEFRAIVVYVWRDICVQRAELIDEAVLVKE